MDRKRSSSMRLEQIFIILAFFLMGSSFLMLQIIFIKLLSFVFGLSLIAGSVTLTAFFFGLALGSHLSNAIIQRFRNGWNILGFTCFLIASYALAFPFISSLISNNYFQLISSYNAILVHLALVVFSIAGLIIPTTAIGSVFPVINHLFMLNKKEAQEPVSILYSINTFGSLVGVIVGVFLIFEYGINFALVLSSIILFVIGIGFLWIGLGYPPSPLKKPTNPLKIPAWVLLLFGLSGLFNMGYELLWTIPLSSLTLPSGTLDLFTSWLTQSGLLITLFLAGISLGSYIFRNFSRGLQPEVLISVLEALIAVTSLLVLLTFFGIFNRTILGLVGQDNIVHFSIVCCLIFASAIFMGGTFPPFVRLSGFSVQGVKEGFGKMYAANLLGSALGPLVTSLIAVPLLGVRSTILALAFGNILIAIFFLFRASSDTILTAKLIKIRIKPVLSIFLGLLVVVPVFLQVQQDKFVYVRGSILFYKESVDGIVDVSEISGHRFLRVYGVTIAGTDNQLMTLQKLLAYIPLILHKKPKNVLEIGLGTGTTAHSVINYGVDKLTIVEISQSVVDSTGYFNSENHNVLDSDKVHLIVGDGRNYVFGTPEKYDVIISETVHPNAFSNSDLYTREYFQQCKRILSGNGTMAVWVPLFITNRQLKSILLTFNTVFPHVSLWYPHNSVNRHLLLMGSMEPLEIDLEQVQSRIKQPHIYEELADLNLGDAYALLDTFMLGTGLVKAYSNGSTIATDDNQFLTFDLYPYTTGENLEELLLYREPVSNYVYTDTNTKLEDINSTINSNYRQSTVIIRGYAYMLQGNSYEAMKAYETARALIQAN